MKLLAVLSALGLTLAAAAPAGATDLEFFTGEALYAQCSAKAADADGAVKQARCLGYVVGVSDAQQALQGAGAPSKVCLQATVTGPKLAEAVSAFLDAHADKRRLAAQDLVLEALTAAFPCK
jgi:hypothetical protein